MTHKRTTLKVFKNAQVLRHNQTLAEARLWAHLRAHQLESPGFRRQHAIGNYIVDFCAPHHRLIIELDGAHHLDQQEYDAKRTAFLEAQGYRVLRFFNNQVMKDIESVLNVIREALL